MKKISLTYQQRQWIEDAYQTVVENLKALVIVLTGTWTRLSMISKKRLTKSSVLVLIQKAL